MSLTPQNLVVNSNSRISFLYRYRNTHVTSLKSPNFFLSLSCNHFANLPHFRILRTKSPNRNTFNSFNTHHLSVRAFESDGTVQKREDLDNINLDAFLSIVEFLCLASSAVISVGFAVNSAISSSHKPVFAWLWNRVFLWQFVLLIGAVTIGASIRRRQWRRICMDVSKTGGSGVNLVERIQKLEEDLRSSATIIRVLSRQFEKLGIRFRVTRTALKEPIAETAALAQKNSEATRALAVQEDILVKELSEIQKVLLAMQEQQQKQLELILAIGKTGKLWDSKQGPSQEREAIQTSNSAEEVEKQMGTHQIQSLAVQKEANNDRA